VTVVPGDGTQADFAPADVIYVNAGATRPADIWLDRLRDGGRLILPLTAQNFPMGEASRGAVFRIERRGDDFHAARISAVAIFPCAGGRDADGEAALDAAFARGGVDRVRRLYRGRALPAADQCWLKTDNWALAYG
jgi:protein-L-isoaspartate(D-aspartate) O-methyltransferase